MLTNAKDNREALIYYYGLVVGRIGLDANATEEEKIKVATNLISEAESGEDFTPRYENHKAEKILHRVMKTITQLNTFK